MIFLFISSFLLPPPPHKKKKKKKKTLSIFRHSHRKPPAPKDPWLGHPRPVSTAGGETHNRQGHQFFLSFPGLLLAAAAYRCGTTIMLAGEPRTKWNPWLFLENCGTPPHEEKKGGVGFWILGLDLNSNSDIHYTLERILLLCCLMASHCSGILYSTTLVRIVL